MKLFILAPLIPLVLCLTTSAQRVHENAHAHNDYLHQHPLMDALRQGFYSVEADVHLRQGKLVVAHAFSTARSPALEKLYLRALDSLLQCNNGLVSAKEKRTFYLMIDIKTEGEGAFAALRNLLVSYPRLRCNGPGCAVKIFVSGNRPIQSILTDSAAGISLDGRPSDLGKKYSPAAMPVVSDNFGKWSGWNGRSQPREDDLAQIRGLAQRVHEEGKRLRLWAIPDNPLAWDALLNAGVDLINTDHLEELNNFLNEKGK